MGTRKYRLPELPKHWGPCITLLTVIEKADIVPAHQLVGLCNADPVKIDGKQYPARSLVYLGFSGGVRLDDGKKFHGRHGFKKDNTGDRGEMSFADIPGWGEEA